MNEKKVQVRETAVLRYPCMRHAVCSKQYILQTERASERPTGRRCVGHTGDVRRVIRTAGNL